MMLRQFTSPFVCEKLLGERQWSILSIGKIDQ
jgi:hypothetical protein